MWSPDSTCTYTKTNPVFIRQVIADFNINNGDTSLCAGEQITLVNNSLNATNNIWTLGNGQSYNGVTPPPYQINVPGIYTVTLAIDNSTWGCKDTLRKNLPSTHFLMLRLPEAIRVLANLYNLVQAVAQVISGHLQRDFQAQPLPIRLLLHLRVPFTMW